MRTQLQFELPDDVIEDEDVKGMGGPIKNKDKEKRKKKKQNKKDLPSPKRLRLVRCSGRNGTNQ